MLSIRKKLFKNRKGFTLIELIVVIAILAILAVLAVPRFLDTLENARYRTHNANVKALQSSAVIALAENGIPSNDIVWTAIGSGSNEWAAANFVEDWPSQPVAALTQTYTVTICGSTSASGGSPGEITIDPDTVTSW